MALNPFFLQGSKNEQRLIQELVNEHLKIYGVEVLYIPRKFVRKETIISEINSSKFDDNFLIEAYVSNYEGYNGAGDILTKFGMSLKDELVLIISKERFEDFIAPFLSSMDSNEIIVLGRPREGDLIYFPLGNRIFEVKFVEHEKPFYQLGKNYVYEITCELFEYEDEVIDTSVNEVDTLLENEGYITTLDLVGFGVTATAEANIGTGYVREIFLNNDGYGFISVPNIIFTPAPQNGVTATATATIKRSSDNSSFSVDNIILTNPGFGYTITPSITISGGEGVSVAATCSIETERNGVLTINVINNGEGYTSTPLVSISPPEIGENATALATINSSNRVSFINVSNPGVGYTDIPTVTVADPPVITGVGDFIFNEDIRGLTSNTIAKVKGWDKYSKTLKVSFVNPNRIGSGFFPGEIVVGSSSSSRYTVKNYDNMDIDNKYSQNDEIEVEADKIRDFSETNPFGVY
jgi:hypothetical protein